MTGRVNKYVRLFILIGSIIAFLMIAGCSKADTVGGAVKAVASADQEGTEESREDSYLAGRTFRACSVPARAA